MIRFEWKRATNALAAITLGLALAACSGARVVASDATFGSASDDISLASSSSVNESAVDDQATGIAQKVSSPTSAPRYGLAEVPGVFGAASDCGCGLPCESGTAQWHGRAVFGRALFTGDDDPESCNYFGFDIGRNSCDSCWSVDAFYRRHSGRFDRAVTQLNGATTIGRDSGDFNHLGLKFGFQASLGISKFYGWVGAGPEYFWTDDYVNDDEGFGFYFEAGIGFNISNNWRLRAGVNVHGLDTDVTRINAIDDGESRFLLVIAPVIQLEASF